MKDYKHLDREGSMRVLGQPLHERKSPSWETALWRILESFVVTVGVLGLALVVLWLSSAFLGVYWEVVSNGFAAGRAALRWLMEIPR